MKRFWRKSSFISIFIFIVFTLVASKGITHRTLSTDVRQLQDCLIARSSDPHRDLNKVCPNPSQPIVSPTLILPQIPDANLPEPQRFLSAIADKLPTIPQPGTFEYILLRAYGAAFVNQQPEIKLPPKVILANEQETAYFQTTLVMGKVDNTNDCYLQKSAADAFNKAKSAARISLKSGYGNSDCTRTFATNLRFWRKYADNNTLERVRQGKETAILGVVAPPGASQHLWGLAIDLQVYSQVQRQALNKNGWFQTVENDVPHWTYVGLTEENLPLFGFKNKIVRGINYWLIPL
ncbi:MAG: D-alanyl-D-alanine carboxypeptidase family protein [Tolypothrix brevis GSE-NOS-MK-07-07A]|nr:D-alanyl-D-alanine carboxypeptidase family protein [Tolypothrix brevis GSE-NOS-MK-07-07A]